MRAIETLPDAHGHFGVYGGMFVPETLMTALHELAAEYERAKNDTQFQNQLAQLLCDFAGRPTPLYFAERLTKKLGAAKIYLKREDLLHTGAHKINNALGQILLAQRMGKKRIIAETGAGQHEAVLDCDVLVMCAAVSDYKPARVAEQKIKKRDERFSLELIPARDILKSLPPSRNFFVVGFAAETNDVEEHVRSGCYVRENVIVGDGVVMGNSCEFKNCILCDEAQVPHFNYVGDSILGFRAHLGAGVILSNVKLDHREISVVAADYTIPTGLTKFGAIIGDRTEIGCNAVLNPGTVIGRDCIIYPGANIRGMSERKK